MNYNTFSKNYYRKKETTGIKDLKPFDDYIKKCLSLFEYVELSPEIKQAADCYAEYLITEDSVKPDLVIYNQLFNKNECFYDYIGKRYNRFPRTRFRLPNSVYKKNEIVLTTNKENTKEEEDLKIANSENKEIDKNLIENSKESNADEKIEIDSKIVNQIEEVKINENNTKENDKEILEQNKKEDSIEQNKKVIKENPIEENKKEELICEIKEKEDNIVEQEENKIHDVNNLTASVNSGSGVAEDKNLTNTNIFLMHIQENEKIIQDNSNNKFNDSDKEEDNLNLAKESKGQENEKISNLNKHKKDEKINYIEKGKIPEIEGPKKPIEKYEEDNHLPFANINTKNSNNEKSELKIEHIPIPIIDRSIPVIESPNNFPKKEINLENNKTDNKDNNQKIESNDKIPNSGPKMFPQYMYPIISQQNPRIPFPPFGYSMMNMNLNPMTNTMIPPMSLPIEDSFEEENDPAYDIFNEDYTKYSSATFLEKPVLIVKKNLQTANWFVMRNNKEILGNYNSEDLLYFLGEQIKKGNKFENITISDYHTDVVFHPNNLFDILRITVPKLKKRFMVMNMNRMANYYMGAINNMNALNSYNAMMNNMNHNLRNNMSNNKINPMLNTNRKEFNNDRNNKFENINNSNKKKH